MRSKLKILAIISVLMLIPCFALTACGDNEEANRISEIGNHLYEYTLEDDSYWEHAGVNTNENTAKCIFACSGVQNGNYRGRNLDWYYGDGDICVVHATKTEKRKHASVGISDFSFIANDEDGKYDISKLDYSLVPFATVDDWTAVTCDGSLASHYENTIVITDGEPEIITL